MTLLFSSLFYLLNIVLLVLQDAPTLVWFDFLGKLVGLIAVIGSVVAIIYFFWHTKSREELSKSLAESKELAETRGKKISDLKADLAEMEIKNIKFKDRVNALESEGEQTERKLLRLRGEILALEKQYGLSIHETEN